VNAELTYFSPETMDKSLKRGRLGGPSRDNLFEASCATP
jgi:hypothetical protein